MTTAAAPTIDVVVKNEGYGWQVVQRKTGERLVVRSPPMEARFVRATFESNAGQRGKNSDGSEYQIERGNANWSIGLGIGSDEATDKMRPTLRHDQKAFLHTLYDVNRQAAADIYKGNHKEFAPITKGRTLEGFLQTVPLTIDPSAYDENGQPLQRVEGRKVPTCAAYVTSPVWTRKPAFVKTPAADMPKMADVNALPPTIENWERILAAATANVWTPIEWIDGKTKQRIAHPLITLPSGARVPDPSWCPIEANKRYLVIVDVQMSIKPKNGGMKFSIKNNRVTIVRTLEPLGGNQTDGLSDDFCTGAADQPSAAAAAAAAAADIADIAAADALEREYKRQRVDDGLGSTSAAGGFVVPNTEPDHTHDV